MYLWEGTASHDYAKQLPHPGVIAVEGCLAIAACTALGTQCIDNIIEHSGLDTLIQTAMRVQPFPGSEELLLPVCKALVNVVRAPAGKAALKAVYTADFVLLRMKDLYITKNKEIYTCLSIVCTAFN